MFWEKKVPPTDLCHSVPTAEPLSWERRLQAASQLLSDIFIRDSHMQTFVAAQSYAYGRTYVFPSKHKKTQTMQKDKKD